MIWSETHTHIEYWITSEMLEVSMRAFDIINMYVIAHTQYNYYLSSPLKLGHRALFCPMDKV